MAFVYKSYADLARDIRNWAHALPPISGVCGVPRSGLACANFLAQHLNIPQIPIEHLLDGSSAFRPACSRPLRPVTGPILVVDDTCWSGRTVNLIRPLLNHRSDVIFGAVYASEQTRTLVDFCGYILPHIFHGFQWNLLADLHCERACVDLDGVLCHDWGRPDDGDWLTEYERFLNEARPLLVPSLPVDAIITARLGRYERQTREWLRRHGIHYRRLIMSPFRTPRERAQMQGFADWKARVYQQLHAAAETDDARPCYFLESHQDQASRIARLTGLVTISYDTHEIWNGDHCVPTFNPHPIDNLVVPG